MLAAFPERKKKVRAMVRERFGSKAGPVYVRGSFWQCRYRGRLHRALTPEVLIERLAETAAADAAKAEAT